MRPTHRRSTQINVDAGERDDEPEALLACADAINIACGGHAGDAASMLRCLQVCGRLGLRAGAHPSYPDRAGFGRTTQGMERAALRASIVEQCCALLDQARVASVAIEHVKLHGALYHDANRDPELASLVLGAAMEVFGPVMVVGPPRGVLEQLCVHAGDPYEREGFADRAMRPDGTLVPRGEAGATIDDPAAAAAQALRLAREGYDTICVHGDGPNALAVARTVRAALDAARA